MAKTYLEITNIALRDINEIPLSDGQFMDPRGLQATAKEMVNRAYADILNYSKEWPFLSTTEGNLLQVTTQEGVQEYDFPTYMLEEVDSIDWDSFFCISDTKNFHSPLKALDWDFYNQNMRARDLESSYGYPIFVYRRKDNKGFGLSPIPSDVGFTVSYKAWSSPNLLSAPSDLIAIPDRYYNVLVSRARYYLWMFRENVQQAAMALDEYNTSIKSMHRDLVEKQSISMKGV